MNTIFVEDFEGLAGVLEHAAYLCEKECYMVTLQGSRERYCEGSGTAMA